MRIQRVDIDGIPALEVAQKSQWDQPLPLVVFQHGGTNDKEVVAGYGVELAKRGFRVVLPDALKHGENNYAPIRQISDYFEVWEDGVYRLPRILDYYRESIKDDFIGVGGLSLGGYMTNMQMVKYPEISAAVSLMAGVDTAGAIRTSLSKRHGQREESVLPLEDYPHSQVLIDYSLGENLEALNGRPMYFWHSKDDHWVPFRFTYYPLTDNRALPALDQVEFKITDGDEHVVPCHVFERQASFMEEAYLKHLEKRQES